MSEITAVYADGGLIGPNPSAKGGTWAWCHVNSSGERVKERAGVVLPDELGLEKVTNNISEMVALLRCIRNLPEGWSGTVYSDSQITLGRVFKGWDMEKCPSSIIVRALEYRRRLGRIIPVLLDGHPTKAQVTAGIGKRGNMCSEHNVWCDDACNRARKEWEENVG